MDHPFSAIIDKSCHPLISQWAEVADPDVLDDILHVIGRFRFIMDQRLIENYETTLKEQVDEISARADLSLEHELPPWIEASVHFIKMGCLLIAGREKIKANVEEGLDLSDKILGHVMREHMIEPILRLQAHGAAMSSDVLLAPFGAASCTFTFLKLASARLMTCSTNQEAVGVFSHLVLFAGDLASVLGVYSARAATFPEADETPADMAMKLFEGFELFEDRFTTKYVDQAGGALPPTQRFLEAFYSNQPGAVLGLSGEHDSTNDGLIEVLAETLGTTGTALRRVLSTSPRKDAEILLTAPLLVEGGAEDRRNIAYHLENRPFPYPDHRLELHAVSLAARARAWNYLQNDDPAISKTELAMFMLESQLLRWARFSFPNALPVWELPEGALPPESWNRAFAAVSAALNKYTGESMTVALPTGWVTLGIALSRLLVECPDRIVPTEFTNRAEVEHRLYLQHSATNIYRASLLPMEEEALVVAERWKESAEQLRERFHLGEALGLEASGPRQARARERGPAEDKLLKYLAAGLAVIIVGVIGLFVVVGGVGIVSSTLRRSTPPRTVTRTVEGTRTMPVEGSPRVAATTPAVTGPRASLPSVVRASERAPAPGVRLGDVTARASSELRDGDSRYPASYAVDGRPDTTWTEARTGLGAGEWIEVRSRCSEQLELVALGVVPGFSKSPALWDLNAGVSEASVTLSVGAGVPLWVDGSVHFRDERGWQFVDLGLITCQAGEDVVLRLEIEKPRRGSQYEDTCISDIALFASPQSRSVKTPTSVRPAHPSFECATATSSGDVLICEDVELAEADRLLGMAVEAERKARSGRERDRLVEQQAWWREQRDNICGLSSGRTLVGEERAQAISCLLSETIVRAGGVSMKMDGVEGAASEPGISTELEEHPQEPTEVESRSRSTTTRPSDPGVVRTPPTGRKPSSSKGEKPSSGSGSRMTRPK